MAKREGSDPLAGLDGITVTVDKPYGSPRIWLLSSTYRASNEPERDHQEGRPPKRAKTDTGAPKPSEHRYGKWEVVFGCSDVWFRHTLSAEELEETVVSNSATGSDGAREPFARRIARSIRDKTVDWSTRPASASPEAWRSVRLTLDEDAEAPDLPVDIELERLSPQEALSLSTTLCISSVSGRAKLESTASASSATEVSGLRQQLQQLQRRLESTQQALRDERIKYRTMLSASTNRGSQSRRPVMAPSSSQSSLGLPSSSHSHPNRSSSHSRSGLSSDPVHPSSDDLPASSQTQDTTVRASQRNLSLVNPTRVYRADPRDNDGFLGDSDSD
ncbi:hypothetical protein BCV70DRAFT_202309 [Testicularia cyperi]|uniref:Uncharacterized protein n=1 Tax=Testicularia cyperi TaxID=1882483 RepID=A0A317XIL8_9BASI|nr:hypothetical protein BCV70DRAFT_202309 [Testicularia cyperi]